MYIHDIHTHETNSNPELLFMCTYIKTKIKSYNPMGDVFSLCPPQDWRYPPVIDGYNLIIQSLCDKYNFPFLDTNAIRSDVGQC